VLIDKPAGITSHDVVSAARRALRTRRIGHAGTLDPFATGLLVLLVGYATRLLPYVDGEPKVYDASIAFGAETDTDDVTGTVTHTADLPDESRVRDAIASLTGDIDQVPPAYSAKQIDGQRAYAAARRGGALDLPPTRVVVHEWRINRLTNGRLDTTITCGGGTYIRALARDLGRRCGSAAHLASLRRTRSGTFDIANAVSLDALSDGKAEVRPPLTAIPQLQQVSLSNADVVRVRRGQTVEAESGSNPTAALIDTTGSLVAIAARAGSAWQPRMVIPDA
jgi:tRNA pseudouridine55 synthase